MILKSGFNSIFSYLFCSPTAKKQKLFSTFSMHCFKQKTTEMRNNLFSFETSVKNKLYATSSHLHSLITTVCSAHASPSHGSCPQRARRPLAPPAECHPATSHSLPTASGLTVPPGAPETSSQASSDGHIYADHGLSRLSHLGGLGDIRCAGLLPSGRFFLDLHV